jgi:hypothetical protein
MGFRLLALVLFGLFCRPALAQHDTSPASSDHPPQTAAPTDAASSTKESDPPVAAPAASHPNLTPDAKGNLSPDQMRELTRVVAQNYRENFRKQANYTFVERDVDRTMAGDGHPKSTEIRTYDVIEIYGQKVWRLIEKEDKPLDAKEAAKEEEKVQKIIDKHKGESEEDRKKREEKEEKQREDTRKFVTAIADSHDFRLVGTEIANGREAWVIDCEPRPGYEIPDKDARFVSKFRGRLWIDKQDMQLARVDLEAVDTASVGWVLARIHKGTRMTYEQMRWNDEIWLPKHMTFKFDARVALLKGYNIDGEKTYRDYKEFRSSSKIIGIGQAEDPPK